MNSLILYWFICINTYNTNPYNYNKVSGMREAFVSPFFFILYSIVACQFCYCCSNVNPSNSHLCILAPEKIPKLRFCPNLHIFSSQSFLIHILQILLLQPHEGNPGSLFDSSVTELENKVKENGTGNNENASGKFSQPTKWH